MDELQRYIDEKFLNGILPVSISMSRPLYEEMISKVWQQTTGVPIREDTMRWQGIPVQIAENLLSGYVINWSDGTSSLVGTIELSRAK